MSKVAFEIVNSRKRKATPCGTLKYDSDNGWSIDLSPNASVDDVPAFFMPFLEKGQYRIDDTWTRRWISERVVPPERQNLGEVLSAHTLLEYDELTLLRSGQGKSSQDDYAIIELDSEESRKRTEEMKDGAHRALGKNIKARRISLGLSQHDLANRLGIYQPALSKIESGKANPTFDLLLQISSCLEVDLWKLLVSKKRALWNSTRDDILSLLMNLSQDLGFAYQRLVDELETYSEDDDSATVDSMIIAHCFRELLNTFPSYVTKRTLPKGKQAAQNEALASLEASLDLLEDKPADNPHAYELVPRQVADNLRAYKMLVKSGTETKRAKDNLAVYDEEGAIGVASTSWEAVRSLALAQVHLAGPEAAAGKTSADEYVFALESVERSIRTRLGNLYDSKHAVEKILARANSKDSEGMFARPVHSEVLRTIALINERHLEWRFFSELKNPLWFDALDQEKAFTQCLESKTLDGSPNDFLPAPYFQFCAGVQPDLVVRFFRRHADAENVWFRMLVLDLAKGFVGQNALEVAGILIRWIDEGYQRDSYFWNCKCLLPLTQLLLKSSQKAERNAGVRLFEKLVKMHPVDESGFAEGVSSFIESHEYAEYIAGVLECMTSDKRLNTCSNHVNRYIKLNQRVGSRIVSSSTIIPDVAPGESSFEREHHEHVFVWIDELRSSLAADLRNNPVRIAAWLEKATPVVRRVAFLALCDYIAQLHDANAIDGRIAELVESLLDNSYLYDSEYDMEAPRLLEAYAPSMSPAWIVQFFSNHEERLRSFKDSQRRLYLDRRIENTRVEKDALERMEYHELMILSQFDRDALPLRWRTELQMLERKYGRYARVDHPFEPIVIWGSNSPKSVETLRKMGPSNVIEYARTWESDEEDRGSLVNKEGLSQAIRRLIQDDPFFFGESCKELGSLNSIYLSEILSGWQDAIDAGADIPIDDSLSLCCDIKEIDITLAENPRQSRGASASDMRNAKISIARLLSSILEQRAAVLSGLQAEIVLDLLEWLAISNAMSADKDCPIENDGDPFIAALNLVRPLAITTAGKLIFARHHVDSFAEERACRILDSALPTKTKSYAEIAALAMIIGGLVDTDSPWLRENYDSLFGNSAPDHRQRFMLASVLGCYQPNPRLFDFLRPTIMVSLGKDLETYPLECSWQKGQDYLGCVGSWLYRLFAYDCISFDDELFVKWHELADADTRGSVLNQLCALLGRSPEAPSRIAAQVRKLWKYHEQRSGEFPAALRGARHLLSSNRFTDEWIEAALLKEARLGNLPERWIIFSDEVKNLMTRNPGWGIEYLDACLNVKETKFPPHALQELAPELFRAFIFDGGASDDPMLLACMNKLGRLGLLDLDAVIRDADASR